MATWRIFSRKNNPYLIILLIGIAIGSIEACSSNRKSMTPSPTSLSREVISTIPPATPTPQPTSASISEAGPTLLPIPPLSPADHITGGQEASITLLVYSDFQCPYCEEFFRAWMVIKERHPQTVRLAFRHFPLLTLHDKADIAGAAAEIASRDDKFWEMHDALFDQQGEWIEFSREEFADWVSQLAGSIGLDPALFLAELSSGEELERMQAAFESGVRSGLPGTPFIFFNGEWYRLNPTAVNLEASIQLELLKRDQYSTAPQFIFDENLLYFAHLELDTGEIVIQLFPDAAPATVASFIFLAEQGWYDNTVFHRVETGRLVETGDPTETGLGGPGYLLFDELSDTLSFSEAGMVAMSSSGPNTNGSRYFITLSPLPHLNGARTIFGRVVTGLEYLASLGDRDPFEDLFEPHELVIRKIRIETR